MVANKSLLNRAVKTLTLDEFEQIHLQLPTRMSSHLMKCLALCALDGMLRGKFEEAGIIFKALHRLQPGGHIGPVGTSLVELFSGKKKVAYATLEHECLRYPENQRLKGILAAALALAGNRERVASLVEELEREPDPLLDALCHSILKHNVDAESPTRTLYREVMSCNRLSDGTQ